MNLKTLILKSFSYLKKCSWNKVVFLENSQNKNNSKNKNVILYDPYSANLNISESVVCTQLLFYFPFYWTFYYLYKMFLSNYDQAIPDK